VRCKACNKNLTDREASTKWPNWTEIENPEERYIMLCDKDIALAGLTGVQNQLASDEEVEDEREQEEDDPNE
jgi:hypothetical protein